MAGFQKAVQKPRRQNGLLSGPIEIKLVNKSLVRGDITKTKKKEGKRKEKQSRENKIKI